MDIRALTAAMVVAACIACSGSSERSVDVTDGTKSPAPAMQAEILEPPFTAAQIRDEWVEGFQVVMRRATPDSKQLERWTVVAADANGAEIEFAPVDENGDVVGEPVVRRSAWTELRDHAAFPAASASREWAHRDTALGPFDGWLYRVSHDEPDAITEFFFVPDLPGAPVLMRVLESGRPTLTLEQVERSGPTEP